MKRIPLLCLLFTLVFCKKQETKSEQNFLFNKLSSKRTGVTFNNKIKDNLKENIISYLYYYNGAGVSVGDFNNDNLDDLYFVSNKGENKLYINKGNLNFEDISEKAGVKGKADWQTGVTTIDINNDGFLDIYVCAVSGLLDFKGHNELYINNGDNTFTEKSKEYNLDYKGYSTQAYFFDYDKDEDLDVYIVNHAVHTKNSHGPAFLRAKRTDLTGDVLLENKNNKFEDSSEKANIYGGVNGYGLSASIADFNNDGWDDIYVCNDFHEDDYYYINNKDGSFTEALAKNFSTISRFSMGSDAADLNGDGFQDLITLDMLPKDERALKESEGDDTMLNVQIQLQNLGYQDQYSRNMLQINNFGAYFHEEALYNNVANTDWSWSPLIADFDNDGNQDLFISNGIIKRPNNLDFKMYVSSNYKYRSRNKSKDQWLLEALKEMPSGKVPNQIFRGNSKQFKNENTSWIDNTPSLSNGAIYSDLDLDGDLDLVTNNINEEAFIYENTTKNKNYISLNFDYKSENKNAIGVKAILYQKQTKQLKQLFNSRGFLSSVSNKLHFGLDTIKKVDSIEIIWPNNTKQTIKDISINKELLIKYNEEKSKNCIANTTETEKIFKPTKEIIDFKHDEDKYNDFHVERLIPFKVSTTGPAIAVADIDKNGFDDLFIGNGSGKAAALYLNDGVKLSKKDINVFNEDINYEDVCATFFDADNDGDLDLYVGSGIHQNRNKSNEIDRLYLNTKNNFTKSNSIPLNKNITACIKAYDYDQDGDTDLFVGNRSNPDDYGEKVTSYLLKNDGEGQFKIDTNFSILSHVTDALWIDLNNDTVKDLVVTTEWDQPKIFINSNGKLTEENKLSNLNGLWQTVNAFDIDKDGDKDLILGNWGENTKFSTENSDPIVMYHSDFDSNGKKETVIAYKLENKYYPIYSKDELASQMNIIKKRFVNYKDYALKTIEDILTKEQLSKATKYTINTLSTGYLINDNGNFSSFKKLAKPFQLSPVNTTVNLSLEQKEHLLFLGNSKSVNTYHGGYENLKGLLLSDSNNFSQASKLGIPPLDSEVRKAEVIKFKDKKVLLILPNNNQIQSFIINEK
ncbi:VCBS repeat-containing protein [Tenacibaculum jejuense]|uniref:ASPIC/UnbV domain protein n=1 Tax=Tenacibaculum jejuense TaxID=584609 RepID=A0A238UDJ4_9FLAO|nr:VCBS repeat-containing protein [Tenacibaculum jejuense]SNR17086.1 ASPIC/UnbV domain protein [Tenacibaculum jejuense]